MMDAPGFDAARSQVTSDEMNMWLRAPVSGKLTEVPGIGPANAAKLRESCSADGQSVDTTHQLLAAFLALKGEDVSPEQHVQEFWLWLKDRGVSSHRSGIVDAVAAKTNMLMPSIEYEHTRHILTTTATEDKGNATAAIKDGTPTKTDAAVADADGKKQFEEHLSPTWSDA